MPTEEEIREAIEEIDALKEGVDYEDGVDGFEFHDKVDAILKRRGLELSDWLDALDEYVEWDDDEFVIMDEANPVEGLIRRGWISPDEKEKWTLLLADEIKSVH